MLVGVTEGFCQRYDLPEQVYQDLLMNQVKLQKHLLENPDYFGNPELQEQAISVNHRIVLILTQRIGEFRQQKSA